MSGLTQQKANALALVNAAALVQRADLVQLFGTEATWKESDEVLGKAQAYAVKQINALIQKGAS